jgi:hypothetical protein
VRRDAHERSPFPARLEHEMQMAMLEVAHAAMHESRRPARRAASEIVTLDECGGESPKRGVTRDTRAGYPSTNDQHIEFVLAESREAAGARGLRTLTNTGRPAGVATAH